MHVQQLGNGVLAPKRYSMQGNAKKQHKAVEPGNGRQRQHAPAGGEVATQHQSEEGEGNGQDLQHGLHCGGVWASGLPPG